jgi:DNA-binding beta-propeller fold protein YncE
MELATDGSIIGTFRAGDGANGLAFDGHNIWVTNENADTVMRLRQTDGALTGRYGVDEYPAGVLFDGTSTWVANYQSHTVTKITRTQP